MLKTARALHQQAGHSTPVQANVADIPHDVEPPGEDAFGSRSSQGIDLTGAEAAVHKSDPGEIEFVSVIATRVAFVEEEDLRAWVCIGIKGPAAMQFPGVRAGGHLPNSK